MHTGKMIQKAAYGALDTGTANVHVLLYQQHTAAVLKTDYSCSISKITASQFQTPNPWYLQGDRTKKTAKSPISLDYPSSCHLSGIGLDKLIHPLLASSKTPFAHTHSSGNVSLGNDTY